MVTENQDIAPTPAPEAPAPEAPPIEEPEVNPIIGEIDSLNNASDNTVQPVAEAPVSTEATPVEEVTPPPPEPPVPQQVPGTSREEIQRLQQQAAEYEQIRTKATLQRETNRYQQQLESQGYDTEQAQQAAQQYTSSKQAQNDLIKQADQYGQHLMGKMAASEHFAQKYKLGMNDLAVLRQSETPEAMEIVAKDLANRRAMEDELSKLRQAQVPTQRFDNSQGSPDVASNDSNWLDRYNAGDRSSSAQSAARRAAGLS